MQLYRNKFSQIQFSVFHFLFSIFCFPFSVTAVIRKGCVSEAKNPPPGEGGK